MVNPDDAFALLDRAQGPIVVVNADGTFQYLNGAVTDVLGFEPAELVGQSAFDLVHPDDGCRVRERFDAAVAGELSLPVDLQYRYGTADGGWITLRSELHGPDATGIDGYVLSSRDVTEVATSRRRLEEIAAKSPDVLWMFTADWEELLFVNGAVEEVFGLQPDALEECPRAFLEHVHPEDRPYVERAMRRLSAGESTLLDYRVDPGTGFSRWVRVPAEPIREDGEVVRVAGLVRDVSEEYKRNRQLTVMDNLLRHTLRNDMNVITGTADRILDAIEVSKLADPDVDEPTDYDVDEPTDYDVDEPTDYDVDEPTDYDVDESTDPDVDEPTDYDVVETVAAHARTIRRVGETLLDTAEKQREVIELLSRDGSPTPIDVADVAEEAVERIERRCPNAAIAIDRPSEARAFTHPEIEQAVVELIENAIEHAEAQPNVCVGVEAKDGDIEIEIRDNCPPIPPEELLVVTDQREMTDLRHTDGMGLWLAYWVADRSGGELTFDTHADGNVVRLRLPNAGAIESDDPGHLPSILESGWGPAGGTRVDRLDHIDRTEDANVSDSLSHD